MTIKLALIDNDQAVRVMTDLAPGENEDRLDTFLREINDGLIPGETAHLEIEGSNLKSMSFEITKEE